MRCHRVFMALLSCSILLGLPGLLQAGGDIDDPQDGPLEAGAVIQPNGNVDPIHNENHDTVTVQIHVRKPNETSSTEVYNEIVEPDWYAPDPYTIPGGDYIGGHWHVLLLVNDNVVAITGGSITNPGE
jgi:hypothetical protein